MQNKYCLGQWEKAIAFAPYVSLDFWKECVELHAEFLRNQGSEDASSYYLLSNNIDDVTCISYQKLFIFSGYELVN
jgi:WD repeat-containing protein 17